MFWMFATVLYSIKRAQVERVAGRGKSRKNTDIPTLLCTAGFISQKVELDNRNAFLSNIHIRAGNYNFDDIIILLRNHVPL